MYATPPEAPSSRRRLEIACSRLLSPTATSFQPASQQVVLGDDLPGPRHEQQQDVELPIGNRHRFAGSGQATSSRIELERFEDEARAGRHGQIVSGTGGLSLLNRRIRQPLAGPSEQHLHVVEVRPIRSD